jgi:hypothetical protein
MPQTCPRCGDQGHYVYNWWCENCWAHRQDGYMNPVAFDYFMLQEPNLADLVFLCSRGRRRHVIWKWLDED